MADSPTFAAIDAAYATMQKKINGVLAQCKTEAQRTKALKCYEACYSAYWAAIHRVFVENDPLIKSVRASLATATAKLRDLDAQLTTVEQALAIVVDVAQTAISLAGLAVL